MIIGEISFLRKVIGSQGNQGLKVHLLGNIGILMNLVSIIAFVVMHNCLNFDSYCPKKCDPKADPKTDQFCLAFIFWLISDVDIHFICMSHNVALI